MVYVCGILITEGHPQCVLRGSNYQTLSRGGR